MDAALTLDAAADELYSLAPEQFVARRTELVKQARAARDRPLAQQIGALRRPTVAAWLLNLGVRNSLTSLVALLHLVREVRAAEAERDGARVRDLGRRRGELERRVVADLPAFGAELGIEVRPAVLDEVRATLRGVLADPGLAERLAAGRLERAGDQGGLDLMAALGAMTADLSPIRTPAPETAPAADVPVADVTGAGAQAAGPQEGDAGHRQSEQSELPHQSAEQEAEQRAAQARARAEREQQARDRARRQEQADAARAEERRTQDLLDDASRELTAAQQRTAEAAASVADLERQLSDAREVLRRREADADTSRDALSAAVLAHEAARAARAEAESRLS